MSSSTRRRLLPGAYQPDSVRFLNSRGSTACSSISRTPSLFLLALLGFPGVFNTLQSESPRVRRKKEQKKSEAGVMRTSQLLEHFSLTDLFTHVYVLVDDHFQQLSASGHYRLPKVHNRQATPSELVTIALVVGGVVALALVARFFSARP